MNRLDELRRKALANLREFEVLMVDGHFDYGNGYHGRAYLNPHRIFRQPSLIWRFAQDLIDTLPPEIVSATDVVAGPVMGGALLAHTMAGLLDGRRSLTHPPTSFAPLSPGANGTWSLRPFYRTVVAGKRVLLADDVRNTGETFQRAKAAIDAAGGTVIATVQIYDRMEAIVDLGIPNVALAEYKAPENYAVGSCPMCKAGQPITAF
jgi:orotate phosphoribosyltransferase